MNTLLAGFEFVPADNPASLTLDNQMRIYINATARRLLDIKPYDRLAVAYRSDKHELAIVKDYAGKDSQSRAEYLTSNFAVDKRYYLHTRVLARLYGFSEKQAPYRFDYERGASDGSIFVFRLIKE